MRARNIKPGFFLNEELAALQPLARLLFAALWCLADREGRLEDRPLRIKAEALPYDDVDVNTLLNELAAVGFICRYENGNSRLIEVSEFGKHQRPHPTEKPSDLPGREKVRRSREKVRPRREKDSGNPSDSLIPDSLIPDSLIQNISAFDRFYSAYPVHKNKQAAINAWKKLNPSPELVTTIMAAIENQKRTRQWMEGICPHPSTWLNNRRWEDEVDTLPNLSKGTAQILEDLAEIEAAKERR